MADTNAVRQRHHISQANGIALHYVQAGSGDPVLLLHGFSQTWFMWSKDIIPALARDYLVIAPDLRGAGDSEKPPSGYDKRTMAEDIHALVTGLGHRRVKIVAHDFGAAVACAYAATYRDEVERPAVFEILIPGFGYEDTLVYPFPEDGTGRKVWHMTFHNAPYGIPEFLISGRERPFRPRPLCGLGGRAPGVRASVFDARWTARAEVLPDPCRGRRLQPCRGQAAARDTGDGGAAFIGEGVKASLERLAKNVEGGVIPDCGHWVTAEQPQFVIDKVRAFLSR